MPIPLIAAGAMAGGRALLSNPWVQGILASALPSVISALTGSPTEAEAKARVGPERENMIAAMAARGMDRAQAETVADQAIGGKVKELMDEGGLPPFLEGALSVGAGLAAGKFGSWLKGRGAAKALTKAAPVTERGLTVVGNAQPAAGGFKRPTGPFATRPGAREARSGRAAQGEFEAPEGDMSTRNLGYEPPRGPRTYEAEAEVIPQKRIEGPFARPRGDLEPEYRRPQPQREQLRIGEDPDMRQSRAVAVRAAAGAGERGSALDEIAALEEEAMGRQMGAMRKYDELQRNRGNFLPPGQRFQNDEMI